MVNSDVLLIEEKKEEPKIYLFMRPISEYSDVMSIKDENCNITGHIIFSDCKFKYEENDTFDKNVVDFANKLYPLLAKEDIYLRLDTLKFKYTGPVTAYVLIMYTNRSVEEAYEIFDRVVEEIGDSD